MKIDKKTESLLQKKFSHLTNDEIKEVLKIQYKLADILFDKWLENKKDAIN